MGATRSYMRYEHVVRICCANAARIKNDSSRNKKGQVFRLFSLLSQLQLELRLLQLELRL